MAGLLLEIAEGVQPQTSTEQIAYTLTVTNYPGSGDPSSVTVTVIDTSDGSDVTSTVMPTNEPSVSSDVITLSLLRSLTAGRTYHVRIQYTRSSNVFQPYAVIQCPF